MLPQPPRPGDPAESVQALRRSQLEIFQLLGAVLNPGAQSANGGGPESASGDDGAGSSCGGHGKDQNAATSTPPRDIHDLMHDFGNVLAHRGFHVDAVTLSLLARVATHGGN